MFPFIYKVVVVLVDTGQFQLVSIGYKRVFLSKWGGGQPYDLKDHNSGV